MKSPLTKKRRNLKVAKLSFTKFSKLHLLFFALIFGSIGAYVLFHGSAASSTANVFVSPNGSDSGANCKRFAIAQTNPDASGTTLCASFNKAYQLASLGDTVEVEGGSYAEQIIPYTSAKPSGSHCDWAANNNIYAPVSDYSGCINFVPASGDTVNIGGLSSEVPYLKLDGGASQAFRFDRTDAQAPTQFDYCQLVVPEAPLSTNITGTLVNGSNVITGLSSTANLVVGRLVQMTTGSTLQLPPGTKLVSINSSTQVTVSKSATQSTAGNLKFDTGLVNLNGAVTSGSKVITGLSSTAFLAPGQAVSGIGIPVGAIVQSVDSGSQITLSQVATSTGTPTLSVATGCYYGSASISMAGIRTTAYTCYGLAGKPQAQYHDDVITNVWSNDAFVIQGAHNAIINSTFDIGDSWRPDSGSSHIEGCRDTTLTPAATAPGDYLELDHVTIKNALVTHPANACDNPIPACPTGWMSYHVAPLHWEGGTNSRIVRSTFENNGAHNIEYQPEDGYPTSSNILVENNVFGGLCANQVSITNGGNCANQGGPQVMTCSSDGVTQSNVVYRFNTMIQDPANTNDLGSQVSFIQARSCVWGSGNRIYGNVANFAAPTSFACSTQKSSASVAFDYNVWASGSPCGANDLITDPQLVKVTNPVDGHLQTSSPAINLVPSSISGGCPSMDIDGNSRPQGSGCDAGADEYVAPRGLANLWVDTNGGSCTRSSNPISYSDTNACPSMQAAMTAAQAGDIVIIKNGTYLGQTITSGTKTTAVNFYAETNSQVLLNGTLNLDGVDKIHIYGVISAGSGETRNDLDICDTNCHSFTTQDILVDGFHGKSAFIRGTNVTIDHSEFGGFSACLAGNSEDGFRFWDGTGGSVTPTNDVLRNSVIHDIDDGAGDTCQGTVNAGRHVDCMQNNGGINLTFERNIFYNCPTSNIQDSNFAGATISNILVQNNFLGSTHCCNSIAMGPAGGSGQDCSAIVVRYNTFDGGSVNSTTCGNGALGVQVYGNIFVTNIFACLGGLNNSYNIFHPTDGPVCGTNYKRCTPVWVAPLPAWGGIEPDPHLSSNDTCAINAGDPANYPSTDIDGDLRPQGGTPDAGADEYLSSYTPPPPPTGGTPPPTGGSSSPPPNGSTPKTGDCNADNKVDVLDLSILLAHYNQSLAGISYGDLNSSGKVDVLDLSILLANYGR